ncbi:hypothetical protein LINGRAPRIM_LOCUS430 [Linum grandiflorum]
MDMVGFLPLPGQHAWEPAEGLVVYPPITRVMPGRPKTVRRKEAYELEVRAVKNGGTMLGWKGILMHCSKCSHIGHNARNCQAGNQGAIPTDVHTPSPVRRRARGDSPEGDIGRQHRVICGLCQGSGHNARTCSLCQGVQAIAVDPNTSARVRQHEGLSAGMRPTRGTRGARGTRRGRGNRGPRGAERTRGTRGARAARASGAEADVEVMDRPSQPTPPPCTQPYE